MADPTHSELLTFLRGHEFLTPAQAQQLGEGSPTTFADSRALARELVARTWLTTYQANQLIQGRGQELLLGPYRLLDRLGEGGMGQVFKAHHVGMDRVVALKVIAKECVAHPLAVKRFHREVQAVAKLSHPNVVTAFDVSQAGDTHFLAMEYVEGIDLARLVQQSGPLPVANACEYIRQAALGLQHAHERGLVHRDIKPGNLMVARPNPDEPPLVKILDFGLARFETPSSRTTRLTQLGKIVGTVDYIAPEQAENAQTADIRADIYSLGCSLYYLLTGAPPYPGDDAIERIGARLLGEAPSVRQSRPEVSTALEAVLARMMARKPEDRFQKPGEVAQALQPFASALEKGLTAAPPATAQTRTGDSASRRYTEKTERLPPPAAPEQRLKGHRSPRRQPAPVLSIKDAIAPAAVPAPAPATVAPIIRGRRPERRGGPSVALWLGAAGFLAVLGVVVVVVVQAMTRPPTEPKKGQPIAGKDIRADNKDTRPDSKDRAGPGDNTDQTKPEDKKDKAAPGDKVARDDRKSADSTRDPQSSNRPPPSAEILPGLLAYWPFDEGKGDAPADVSEGGVRGKGHNIEWVDGVRGRAIRLKGKGSYFDFSAHPRLNFAAGADFTFCGWVRTRQTDGPILSNTANADGTPTIDLHIGSGTLRLEVRQQGATDYIATLKGDKAVSDGAWHHFAFTRRGADLALYLDGALERRLENSRSGGAIPTDLRALGTELSWLKVRKGLDTDYLAGDFDEFCVFGRALSAAEIGRLAGLGDKTDRPDQKPSETQPDKLKNSLGMRFVTVPAGTFWMSKDEKNAQQEVRIAIEFQLAVYPVTQEQWQIVMGNNPSHFSRGGAGKDMVKNIPDAELNQFPVENVSWTDAQEFLKRLNEKEKDSGWQYRLPSEAEWEYACRGRATSKEDCSFDYYFNQPTNDIDSTQANFNGSFPAGKGAKGPYLQRPTKVGSYQPNRLGIYDLHGNVWEWCEDPYDVGQPPRVFRGGSWDREADFCRAARRGKGGEPAVDRRNNIGFRLARVPVGKATKTDQTKSEDKPDRPDQKQSEPLPKTFKNSLGMEFVLVPKGKSWLGGGGGKPGTKEVEIPQDFYLGKYLVTQEEWRKVMGSNPSYFSRTGKGKTKVTNVLTEDLKRFPVDSVSWDDAQGFLTELNKRIKDDGWVYRLPTEAEWEYACRGGPLADKQDSTFDYYFDKPTNQFLRDMANFDLKRPCKVGSYKPNRLGLYDMHGNVWEWCDDRVVDTQGLSHQAKGDALRVERGGCWHDGQCHTSTRISFPAAYRSNDHGFRLARVPVAKTSK